MTKTRQQTYDEIYAQNKSAVDEQHANRKAADAETIDKINKSIDTATKAATGQYQQQIDNAPMESQAGYDKNAMADAVSRMRIKESLANMGMTDSGLSGSMHTALEVQKSRADAGVRSAEQKKIQEARNAIARLTAEAEGKKAQNEIDIDRDTYSWYTQMMADMPAQARQQAESEYQFDESLAESERNRQWQSRENQTARDWQGQQNQMERDFTAGENDRNRQWQEDQSRLAREWESQENQTARGWQEKQNQAERDQELTLKGLTPLDNSRTAAYYEAYSAGYSDEEATIYEQAGGGEKGNQAVSDHVAAQALNFASGLSTKMTGTGILWSGKAGDGEAVADKIKSQTENNAQFKAMSPAAQNATLTYSAALFVKTNWPNAKAENNEQRLKAACNNLGVDYNTALAIYNDGVF